MRKQTRFLTHSAMIAALYAALTHLQNLLLPGSASWAIQFRISEALCVLSLFTPAAIPGLSIGCLIFNLTFSGTLPLDFLIGTAATFLATGSMYLLRNQKGYPFLALAMPAIFNAFLVGGELSFYIGGGFLFNFVCVFIGEAVVLFALGTGLYYAMKAQSLDKRLFG